eukprot:TRINITY_DN2154_c0_g1_i3.p1 TRINITY_DN2154_c0_g1~~TRINITY_DN2154_c0_g1_i3.p1  ORF type:complete len:117 (+),score=9.93 TRINITY_DN2154_c0_g1_i3:31-351(+)
MGDEICFLLMFHTIRRALFKFRTVPAVSRASVKANENGIEVHFLKYGGRSSEHFANQSEFEVWCNKHGLDGTWLNGNRQENFVPIPRASAASRAAHYVKRAVRAIF